MYSKLKKTTFNEQNINKLTPIGRHLNGLG